MTAEENDSLARQNIDPDWWDTWEEQRTQYSYDFPPDHRAELFNEYVETDEAQVERWAQLAEGHDATSWEQQAAEYYGEAEEVPF